MRRLQLVEQAEEMESADIPNSIRVALASNDCKNVNAHFGSTSNLMIYQISETRSRFVEAIAFDDKGYEDSRHNQASQDRIEERVAALDGCAILFVLAIGGGPAARVVNHGIYPIKLQGPESFAEVIERVQKMLAGTPPPWLRKLIGKTETEDEISFSGADEEEDA